MPSILCFDAGVGNGQVYGGPSAWPLLEDGSYQVVQEKLFEKEDEEKQKQDQPLLLEGQQVEELPPQVL